MCATFEALRHFFLDFPEAKEGKTVGNYKHQHRVDGIINKYQNERKVVKVSLHCNFLACSKLFRTGNKRNFRLFSHVIYEK